jgi:hypothetical protein
VALWVGEIGAWEAKEAAGSRGGNQGNETSGGRKGGGRKVCTRVDDNGGPPLEAALFVPSGASAASPV